MRYTSVISRLREFKCEEGGGPIFFLSFSLFPPENSCSRGRGFLKLIFPGPSANNYRVSLSPASHGELNFLPLSFLATGQTIRGKYFLLAWQFKKEEKRGRKKERKRNRDPLIKNRVDRRPAFSFDVNETEFN